MFNSFHPTIYREVDETDARRGVWVRIEPSRWGVTIATFKDEPSVGTPEWQAMTVVHFDPCFNNVSKVVAWDEHSDSENSEGQEIILVESVDEFKPRDGGQPSAELRDGEK